MLSYTTDMSGLLDMYICTCIKNLKAESQKAEGVHIKQT